MTCGDLTDYANYNWSPNYHTLDPSPNICCASKDNPNSKYPCTMTPFAYNEHPKLHLVFLYLPLLYKKWYITVHLTYITTLTPKRNHDKIRLKSLILKITYFWIDYDSRHEFHVLNVNLFVDFISFNPHSLQNVSHACIRYTYTVTAIIPVKRKTMDWTTYRYTFSIDYKTRIGVKIKSISS